VGLAAFAPTRGPQSDAKGAQPAVQAPLAGKAATVEMHLKIRDEESGFTLEAKKSVPRGTSAFEALRQVVVVDYKRQPGFGQFITGLCGIEAQQDQFWALYINDKFSKQGIGSIKLVADTKIEWKTHSRDTFAQ
jgi:hypothetical protein